MGNSLSFEVGAKDNNLDPLTLTVQGLPSGAKFTLAKVENGRAKGDFNWIPNDQQVGNHTVTFSVTDGQETRSETINIEVTKKKINTAPKITSSPLRTITKGTTYKYGVTVSNPDNDKLNYKVVQGPDSMTFKDNVLTWVPKKQEKVCVIIEVNDGVFHDTQHFCINVRETTKELKFNEVRVWPEYINAGDHLPVYVGVTNDGDDLEDLKVTAIIYELGVKRSGDIFDLDNGESIQKYVYLDIPGDAESGEYYVRVTVSNDEITHVAHRVVEVN